MGLIPWVVRVLLVWGCHAIRCPVESGHFGKDIYGGDSDGVPPLPIPNREVKPVIADGTAMQCGRVGSRLFSHEGRFRQWAVRRPSFFVLSETGVLRWNTGLISCRITRQTRSDSLFLFNRNVISGLTFGASFTSILMLPVNPPGSNIKQTGFIHFVKYILLIWIKNSNIVF